MKPLRLEFCGINSFSEKTVIDFKNLTKNGIFGIFGDTGSGKSTILDSINFALYGDVDRSKEKTDIINYRCDILEVKFTFEVTTEGERKTYTVERSLKKNKSGTHKATLFDDTNNISIADNATSVKNKIISIIGLEADDFRKCIALPQGEFSQFVKSQTSDRIKLIERLFSLSKYGIRLKEKLFVKEKATDENYNELLGKLSVYNDINSDILSSTLSDINTTKDLIITANSYLKETNAQYEKIKFIYESKLEFDNVNNMLNDLKKDREHIENLRKSLSLIEGAKSVININDEILQKKDTVNQITIDLNLFNNKKLAAEQLLKEKESELVLLNIDSKIANSLLLLGKYEAVLDLPKKLEVCKSKLFELRNKYVDSKKLLDKLLLSKESYNLKLDELETKIKSLKVLDIESFVKTKYKDLILKEEYGKQINIYADLRSDIKTFEDGSELYKYVKKRFTEQIKFYEQKILLTKDVNTVKIYEELKSLKNDLDLKDQLISKFSELKNEKIKLDGEISFVQSELDRIQKDGEEKSAEKADIQFKLKQVFGESCGDYTKAIELEKQNFGALSEQKQRLNSYIDKIKAQINDFDVQISAFNSKKSSFEIEIKKFEDNLTDELNKLNFKCVDDCINLVVEFEKYSNSANETILQFDKNFLIFKNRKENLLKIDGIDKVCEQHVLDALSSKNECEEKLNNLNSCLAVLQSRYEDLQSRLNAKTELEKQFAEISAQRNLIHQLKDLIKNNKFLEFIANEYLYEISSIASGTLLKLTCGRYYLTYKENFYVGDNYDCGNLRGVNTLSGGETFLVSLSLALALSSTICAKALKSIEFFFLDEGFGTLDETLIDTVMDALEKLKSEQFTIGIISHVEELKHRIDSKITVNKATESHGSTVQISC